MLQLKSINRVEVGRDVVSNGGVWAAARLDRNDPIGRQDRGIAERHCIFGREDVVGDDHDRQLVAKQPAQRPDEGCLTAADGPAPTDPQCSVRRRRPLGGPMVIE